MTKTYPVASGNGGLDPVSFDAVYLLDIHDGLFDAVPPANFFQTQDAEHSSSAQAIGDQFGWNENDGGLVPLPEVGAVSIMSASVTENALPADPFGIQPATAHNNWSTADAATPVNHFSIESLVTAGDSSPAWSPTIAHSETPSLLGHATVAVDAAVDSFPFASFASGIAPQNSASKPVATIPQLADYLVNGFWQFNGEIAHHWGSSTISYNITGLNAAEQFLAQSALEAWHEVTNLNFVLTTGAANITFNHNGTMTAFETDSYNGSGIMSSATVDISADWITNDGGAMDGKTGIDSYGYQTYIHEIGHALGLGHQGPYNGSAGYSTDATYADDTWQYSVMSYFSENNYNGGSYRYVITPQEADIYAVDSIYGAASTRPGDTVYGFHDTGGSIYNFSAYTQAPALTIYDSGGTDTLDCSGYSVTQTIDLHSGSFSSVGGLVHNIGIATTTIIEVAIGGSGADTLIANDFGCTLKGGAGNDSLLGATGNDTLVGGTGVDTLTGGAGADIFVFAAGDSSAASGQHDRVTDFTPGADKIDLSGIDAISSTPSIIDAFNFLGSAAFNGVAGVLDYFFDSAHGVTVLQGDTNGDKAADFAIDLAGNIALTTSDLLGIVLAPTVIEPNGSTYLTQVGNEYFLNNTGGAGPLLMYSGGAPILTGQAGAFVPIGAEQTASGYEVAWKDIGTDQLAGQYTVWDTDSSGHLTSNIGLVTGSSAALESLEPSFQQDLNGDGVIGTSLPTTVVESNGSTYLTQVGNEYFLNNTGGAGPLLMYSGGAPILTGQAGAFVPIGAEQTASGYEVAWKDIGTDQLAGQYTVWDTDSSGHLTSNIGLVTGSSAALESLEPSFQQDLNGDGVIGTSLPTTVIESNGSTYLTQVGNEYFLNNTGGAGPLLMYSGGAPILTGQAGAFVPIGAEQTASGYEVAWKDIGTDQLAGQYTVWDTDSSGHLTSNIGLVTGSSAALESLEPSFQQDLNGDGVIGIGSSQGTLAAPSNDALVADPQGGILTGGTGNDTFAFNSPVASPSTIIDFTPGQDLLQILADAFGTGLAAGASPTLVTGAPAAVSHAGSNGYFIFDNTDPHGGTVYWDHNGGSGADATALAYLNGVTSLHPSDFHLV